MEVSQRRGRGRLQGSRRGRCSVCVRLGSRPERPMIFSLRTRPAWGILAYVQMGRPFRPRVSYLLRSQHRSGGWGWIAGAGPDSNDTAAVIQALRTQGVRGPSISRGIAYLRRLQNADGGFELTPGRGSDTQSTAWAIQAFVAARVKPPAGAFRYLAALRRADGSYRYSRKYGATPVWVTSQVLPALARKSFPLR
ncbi:MAG: hypothetical protein E6G09_15420 [Actinobacteria bacterium]|nr:MAG: hypothetical protein E6G09_15420 [Actinomycetota bacterium]